jgi:hypothetical protein
LPGVRRWLNLYRTADPIGRDLGIPGVEDVNLCNGGHSGYFEDQDVAAFLVNWLYPGLPAASPAPAKDAAVSGQPDLADGKPAVSGAGPGPGPGPSPAGS